MDGGLNVGEGLAERVEARLDGLAPPEHLLGLAEHDLLGQDRVEGGFVVVAEEAVVAAHHRDVVFDGHAGSSSGFVLDSCAASRGFHRTAATREAHPGTKHVSGRLILSTASAWMA